LGDSSMTRLEAAFFVMVFFGPFTTVDAQTIGRVKTYDASTGSSSDQLLVADLIKITLDQAKADGVPTSDVVSGDAVRRVALVQDGTSYVAYYVADKVGSSTLKFSYTIKGTTNAAFVTYQFVVALQSAGRTLDVAVSSGVTGVSITDSSTGKPPLGGVRVGDVLRLQVSTAGIDLFGASVVGGDAVRKASTVATPDEKTYLSVFSADKVGTANIVYSFRITPNGDGGAILPITVNH